MEETTVLVRTVDEDEDLEAASLAMGNEATPTTEVPDFRSLYERHSEVVYLTALRVTGNPADAEDVLQTVFLRLMDGGPEIDASRSPAGYLRRAAVNAAIDVLRRKGVRRESDVEPEGEVAAAAVRPAGPEGETAVLKERLRRALASLSRDQAELFVLFHLEGYRYEELAELLQLEAGTVGSRLHRIRAALQKELSR